MTVVLTHDGRQASRARVGVTVLAIAVVGATWTGCGDDAEEQAGTTANPTRQRAERTEKRSSGAGETTESGKNTTRETNGDQRVRGSAERGDNASGEPKGQTEPAQPARGTTGKSANPIEGHGQSTPGEADGEQGTPTGTSPAGPTEGHGQSTPGEDRRERGTEPSSGEGGG
jgi:hypothetical protein